jgi:putative endonuclease
MVTAGKLECLWLDAQQSGLRWLARIAPATLPAHLATGVRGELATLFELRRRGCTVVARRWSSPKMRGDIDLIAWDGGTLCFIEVKTRMSRGITPAEVSVDDDKRRMLRGLARIYLNSFPKAERSTIPVRFDIVSVYPGAKTTGFEFFPGAFGWR